MCLAAYLMVEVGQEVFVEMSYSNQTVAHLCRALYPAVNSHDNLDLLFLETDVPNGDRQPMQARCNALVTTLRGRDTDGTSLTPVVKYVLDRRGLAGQLAERLLQSLRIDGFEWLDGKLVPTTPEPASLEPELSLLEMDLQELNLGVAARHYRQAHENFVNSNWAAANGQLRSFMEDFLIELGKIKTKHNRTDPNAAIQDLRHQKFFDEQEFQMLKAFWQGIQDGGPHRGLSDGQEGLFRLHMATSIARYVIHKVRSIPS
jgi:hypothetical protein